MERKEDKMGSGASDNRVTRTAINLKVMKLQREYLNGINKMTRQGNIYRKKVKALKFYIR